MSLVALIFWASIAVVVYIYVLYPALACTFSVFKNRAVKKGGELPLVTVIISAYNEEASIRETLENKLGLDYPANKVDILVVSDGSTDSTDRIVKEFEKTGRVRLIMQEPRQGKTSALNLAAPQAKGDIVVFSDANSIYEKTALRELALNFKDPEVGYVTGKMLYKTRGSSSGYGCSAYIKYENLLRKIENSIGSIVGVNGGIDAMRKVLYRPLRHDLVPDLILSLKTVESGFRAVYDPSAVLYENSLEKSSDEYKMRVRVSLRALQGLWNMKHLLNLIRYGLFSWQLFSHKVLRYLVFVFLVAAFITNMALAAGIGFYALLFAVQLAFYAAAIGGYWLEKRNHTFRPFDIPFYFCLINIASAQAFWMFLKNDRPVVWAPRKGW